MSKRSPAGRGTPGPKLKAVQRVIKTNQMPVNLAQTTHIGYWQTQNMKKRSYNSVGIGGPAIYGNDC